jgi:hypothetical protein
MGAAKQMFTKLATDAGFVKKMNAAGANMKEPAAKAAKPVAATMAEKQEAARRRARRIGSRSLLSGGRLASAAEDEGTQTTLGAR